MILPQFQSSILNFFVGVFSKTLIVGSAVSSQAVMTYYVSLSGYIEKRFYMLSEMKFSLQRHPCTYKTLALKVNSWFLQFYTAMVHLTVCKSNMVCFNLALHWTGIADIGNWKFKTFSCLKTMFKGNILHKEMHS